MSDNNMDPNSNAAFSQTSAQSNPFTGELKGEFSSDFGTSTNAVSQIFKGGSFGGENKGRLILIGVGALAILGFAFWYLNEPSDEMGAPEVAEEAGDGATDGETPAADASKPAEAGATAEKPAEQAAEQAAAAATETATPVAEGAITLTSPDNGRSQPYDETNGPAEFQWQGPADEIHFSRSSTMSPLTRVAKLNGASSYSFDNPYPGTWYWQVKNATGMSEVRSFKISASPRRSFPVTQPTPGGSLTGNGGVVTWQAGEKIARYSVELVPAGQSFANANYRFGTSGTSVPLQGVSPGVYDLRVGAFSEVAGRWEWQVIEKVNIQ